MRRLAAVPLALLALSPTLSWGAPAGSTLLVSRPTATPLLSPGTVNHAYTRGDPDFFFPPGAGENVSDDGTKIVFTTQSDGLSTADDNHYGNCFVRDMVANTTTLVSRASGASGAGVQAECSQPVISGDGTRVAFVTRATGLDPDATDTNGFDDVYVRNLSNDTTLLVSRDNGGDDARLGMDPTISTTGNEIAFETATSGLDTSIADANGTADVFIRDVGAESTFLVSRKSAAAGDGASTDPSIDGTGNVVAFETTSTNLDAADTNSTVDVHIRNLQLDTNLVASRASGAGTIGDNGGENPALSNDGAAVAFQSTSTNLVASDTNAATDIFVRTALGGAIAGQTTIRASLTDADDEGSAGLHSRSPAISGDAEVVAYETEIPDPSIGDGTSFPDIHARNLVTGTTVLASATTGTPGDSPNNFSPIGASISGNAAHVVFTADFDAASAADNDDFIQVFDRNIDTDTTQLASRPSGSAVGDGMNDSDLGPVGGSAPQQRSVSRDGRFVVFISDANDLVAGQDNAVRNAFRYDLRTDSTILVSRSNAGTPANGNSREAVISADGSKVAFTSSAVNLENGNGATERVYWRDVTAGLTKLLSRRSGGAGAVANSNSGGLSMSSDGTRVAFASSANNLHPDGAGVDLNGTVDIFVRDVPTDTTLMASLADDESLSNGFSSKPALDADGSRVAFASQATNLTGADGNGTSNDVYVRDLATGETLLASRADGAGGAQANNASFHAAIDESGQKVAFSSSATNLAPGFDASTSSDVYLRDIATGTTTLVSRGDGAASTAYNASSAAPAISGDGSKVAFTTNAGDPNENDPTSVTDVYVRDIPAAQTTLASRPTGNGQPLDQPSSFPSISLNGNCVAFTSESEGLTTDYPGFDFTQVYMRVISGECPDATAPETTIDSGPTGLTGFKQATFAFSSEQGASFECRMDGAAFAPCTSPFEVTGLGEGSHTFEVRATDQNGNVDASPATRTFTVDTTLPDTVINTGPSGTIGDATPEFTFSANEVAQGFECRIDAAAFAPCSSPFTTSPLADGAHTFEVRATDAVGNKDASPASRSFSVDTGAPETAIESGPSGPTADATPQFGFSASEPGSTFRCAIDGGPFAVCTSPFTSAVLANGPHTFTVRATDAVGNQDATAATRSFTVDARGPVLRLRFKTQRLTRAARRGLKGTVTSSEGCAGTIVALKRFASRPAALSFSRAGRKSFTLKFKPRARRALLRRKRASVRVRGRCTDELGNTSSITRTRRLRR